MVLVRYCNKCEKEINLLNYKTHACIVTDSNYNNISLLGTNKVCVCCKNDYVEEDGQFFQTNTCGSISCLEQRVEFLLKLSYTQNAEHEQFASKLDHLNYLNSNLKSKIIRLDKVIFFQKNDYKYLNKNYDKILEENKSLKKKRQYRRKKRKKIRYEISDSSESSELSKSEYYRRRKYRK